MGSNNGFTIFYNNMIAKRRFTTILQQVLKARIHNPFAKRVFYNNLYNIHTDTLSPVLILFIYNIHTQGGLGNWLTYILSLHILWLCLNSTCQQRELPLFLVAVAGKFLSFLLFVFGKGRVTVVTFFSSHRGGVFKGLGSSWVYLYFWLPE